MSWHEVKIRRWCELAAHIKVDHPIFAKNRYIYGMSRKYKSYNKESLYFVSIANVYWMNGLKLDLFQSRIIGNKIA